MRIREIIDLMERHLPCPPHPMPDPNTEADYLWRATEFNAGREQPLPVVELMPRRPSRFALPEYTDGRGTMRIIRVECDSRGRGVRVIS